MFISFVSCRIIALSVIYSGIIYVCVCHSHSDVLLPTAKTRTAHCCQRPAHKLRPFRNPEPEQPRIPEPAVLRQPLRGVGVEPTDIADICGESGVTGGICKQKHKFEHEHEIKKFMVRLFSVRDSVTIMEILAKYEISL